MINNFDEYCRAFSSGGKLFSRARLLKFLRRHMITVQNLETVRDEEKRNFVGLTELSNVDKIFNGDELTRIALSTVDAVRHISNNFREKIIRENILMPTYRAKEISGAGISWLSKRSGRTIREKLSSTNSLLAVRRRMSLDTGENRLYLAFLRQMEEYLEQKRLADSKSLTDVEINFQQLALKILHDDELEEVGHWENMPPNNTLLSDRFYRQIWHGWNNLQKLSEMIKSDSEHIGERICTTYFFKLIGAIGKREKFPQQPIKYNYEKFELKPLNGNSIIGENLTLTKLEKRIEIKRGEKIFAIEFNDVTQTFFDGQTELLRSEMSAENFDTFVNQTAEFICGASKSLEKIPHLSKVTAAKKNYMDIFAPRPIYTAPNGDFKRFKSRIVRQEFFHGGETYDLPAEFSRALTIDDSSKIYSLTSCIHERKTDNGKFNRLFQMINENFSTGNRRIEQLSLPIPDIYNEFQLSAIRRAVRLNYNNVRTIPRSLAVLFFEMSRDGCQKFSDGDFALVVDYVRGQISLTLVEARFDSRIEKSLPETHGLIWERHPTFSKTCKPEGYANFEEKITDFLLKNGWQASKTSLDKILNVFGVKGLPIEAGRLTFQFDNETSETWTAVTENLMDNFTKIKFSVTDIVKDYLKQRAELIGGKKVFKFIISPQLTFMGANATLRPEFEVPLQGMQFYDKLSIQIQQYENSTREKLPPLWTDRLPFLGIKRLYGVFEIIGRNSDKKILPMFGVTQKIDVDETFTLPKGRAEYRFGLILNDSGEISYEAVVKNPAFPLRNDVECELHLTYTYGKDIPYELIFKPLTSQSFREAKVTWENAAEQDYKNLPSPKFPDDIENWQTLQHIKTRNGRERNALDWIENTFKRRTVIDFSRDEYQIVFKDVFIRSFVDGEPAILQLPKDFFKGPPAGIWSAVCQLNRNERKQTILNSYEWRTARNTGERYCVKLIDGLETIFYANNFLFTDNINFSGSMRVNFEIRETDRGARAVNIIAGFDDVKFYWVDRHKIDEGNVPYDLRRLSVMYPLHKVYANGRTVKTPGCPEHFKIFIEQLAKDLPAETLQAVRTQNTDLYKKLLRIMCVMSSDIGQPLYDIIKIFLDKQPNQFDDDLGCALGDYDKAEQQQLLMQLHGSEMNPIQKVAVLNKAAWKSDGFILNAPPVVLMPYFQSATDFLKNRTPKKSKPILKCLEFILAIFRLRDKGDDTLNKSLSLNNGKIRELYATLEEMIDEGYELPQSRLELEIKRSADYAKKIPDLYYALLFYINGGEDEIKISGINDEDDDA